jgi:hypothetical protein
VTEDEMTFDLAQLSEKRYSLMRGFRTIETVALVGFAVLFTLIAIVNLDRGTFYGNLEVTYGAAYIGLGVVIIVAGWSVWMAGRGAESVRVGSTGVLFQYRSVRKDRLAWTDPRFRLTLRDWTASASILPPASLYDATIPNRPMTQLSPEAFQTIIETARQHNLSITTRPARPWVYGSSGTMVAIRGPVSTRPPA